jgi:hypothetical protein
MVEEYASIMKNDVLEVVPWLEGKPVIGFRWIYKIKHVVDGSVKKSKAMFVVKGFSQKKRINFDDTFAPIHFDQGHDLDCNRYGVEDPPDGHEDDLP